MFQKVTGTRDLYGINLQKRNYIINIIKNIYESYGFCELHTPAFEYINLVKNVYGNENEKLLYRILNSGDCFHGVDINNISQKDFIDNISEKCLRYDLTLPLMRYVYENKNNISFPFKRYQIQPVWRADRPQKGRYREFYQCDVDIVGIDSLLCEVELIQIIETFFKYLAVRDYKIRINHRGVLSDIAKLCNLEDKFIDFCILIDKIDKIGLDKFLSEIDKLNITSSSKELLRKLLKNNDIDFLKEEIVRNNIDTKNINSLCNFYNLLNTNGINLDNVRIDFSLARGLSYYTGIIFEAILENVNVGSVIGGGRYNYFSDRLGIKELKSSGFSVGIDRLLIALEEKKLLDINEKSTDILFINENDSFDFNMISSLRTQYSVEIYLDKNVGLKQQLKYADKKKIKYVILRNENKYIIKNMKTSEQKEVNGNEILRTIKSF